MPARIDDLCARGVLVLHVDDAVVGVDVPMEHICGLIFVHKVVEALEAGVGPAALHVAVAFGGGVGDEDVEAAGQRESREQKLQQEIKAPGFPGHGYYKFLTIM